MLDNKFCPLVELIKSNDLGIGYALPEQLKGVSLGNVVQMSRSADHENAFGMHGVNFLLLQHFSILFSLRPLYLPTSTVRLKLRDTTSEILTELLSSVPVRLATQE